MCACPRLSAEQHDAIELTRDAARVSHARSQIAVIEYARHVLGWSDANSTEMDADTEHPVVVFMPEQSAGMDLGGTMRLGARPSVVKSGTLAHQVYGFQSVVSERHRHRYEVNPECVPTFEAGVAATGDAAAIAGLVFSSTDETKQRMEMVELPTDVHPFFFAVQFHPEFKSRPTAPSPPFLAFIQASARVFVRRAAPSSLRSASPMAHASSSSSEAGLGSGRASPMAGVVGIVDRVASGAASATAAFRTSGAALEDASAMKKAKF
jgi:hypothetical protein